MSKKHNKVQGGNEVVDAGSMQEQLQKVMVSELNVEEAIAAISPMFVMVEFDQLCAMESDLQALKARAQGIVESFHRTRRLIIADYDMAIATRTRVASARKELVEKDFARAIETPAFANVHALYMDQKMDTSILTKQLTAHLEKQAAEKVFPGELEAAEKHLADFKDAYATARKCTVDFIPAPAQDILDEATILMADIKELRESIGAALKGKPELEWA